MFLIVLVISFIVTACINAQVPAEWDDTSVNFDSSPYSTACWNDTVTFNHYVVVGGIDMYTTNASVNTVQESFNGGQQFTMQSGGPASHTSNGLLFRDPKSLMYIYMGGMIIEPNKQPVPVNTIYYSKDLQTWLLSQSYVPCLADGSGVGCDPLAYFSSGFAGSNVYIFGGSNGLKGIGRMGFVGNWDAGTYKMSWSPVCSSCEWVQNNIGLVYAKLVVSPDAKSMFIGGGSLVNSAGLLVPSNTLWVSKNYGVNWNQINLNNQVNFGSFPMMTYTRLNELFVYDPSLNTMSGMVFILGSYQWLIHPINNNPNPQSKGGWLAEGCMIMNKYTDTGDQWNYNFRFVFSKLYNDNNYQTIKYIEMNIGTM